VAVLTGDTDGEGPTGDVDSEVIATWTREWGIVTRDTDLGETPLDRLVSEALSVATVNRDLGLRGAVDDAAREAGLDPEAVAGIETAGVESPARRVVDGRADAGVALRATAERLGLEFASLGTQPVSLVGDEGRLSKPGVERLREAAGSLAGTLEGLPGYSE